MGWPVLRKSFLAIKGREVGEDKVQKADSTGQSRTELRRPKEQGCWCNSAREPH